MDYPYEYRYRDAMRKGKWSPWYSVTKEVADLSRGKTFFEVREKKSNADKPTTEKGCE